MAYTAHLLVGDAASAIVNFATDKNCGVIVMGAHGFSHIMGLFMGSVTVKVVQLSTVPVLLIK